MDWGNAAFAVLHFRNVAGDDAAGGGEATRTLVRLGESIAPKLGGLKSAFRIGKSWRRKEEKGKASTFGGP